LTFRSLAVVVLAVAGAGCGGDDDGGGPVEPRGVGDTLGGGVDTRTLARTTLRERPRGPVAWVADEVSLGPGDEVRHRHEFAFVHVRTGEAAVQVAGRSTRVPAGGGAVVASRASHRVTAGGEGAKVWEIRLAAPGSAAPPGGGKSRRVFESERLEGIPEPARGSFIEVTVPARGGETTVHTHPGPEFIYMTDGRIDYQNEIVGTKRLGPGGAEGIPPATAVQKRNPLAREAVFLSWFLVDPAQPFAPGTEF